MLYPVTAYLNRDDNSISVAALMPQLASQGIADIRMALSYAMNITWYAAVIVGASAHAA
jgi:hypothetical protein